MNPQEPAHIPRGAEAIAARRAFLGPWLSSFESFERLVLSIPPRSAREVDPRAWRDAIVIVERGELELECAHGGRAWFERGAVLWLCGRDPRSLRNRGDEPVVLVAIARRT